MPQYLIRCSKQGVHWLHVGSQLVKVACFQVLLPTQSIPLQLDALGDKFCQSLVTQFILSCGHFNGVGAAVYAESAEAV